MGNAEKQGKGAGQEIPLCPFGGAGRAFSHGAARRKKHKSSPAETEPRQDLQTGLEEILSQIQGAGRVRVLLTQREGERTVYQTDEDSTSSGIRSDTVLLNGSDRSQTGLVQQVNPPTYLGAVIVCQGADSASVRLAIVSAVGSVTGLSTDKITVLKMK